MFVESLLEDHVPQSGRRRWATLLSFLLQAVAIGMLVLLPLFYTQALPRLLRVDEIGPPPGPPPAAAPAEASRAHSTAVVSELVGTTVRAPQSFPDKARIMTDQTPPAPSEDGIFVPHGTGAPGSGTPDFVKDILATIHAPRTGPPPPRLKPVVISGGVTQGLLISQVKPTYPPLAKTAGVQGTVVLAAVISRSGVVENLRVVSGHPLLVEAALEAVRQWRYRPYLLNGQPVEVETQVTVNFKLAR